MVRYINPKNTIRQIARATKMSDLEIRKIVYGLLQAGLVELVRKEGTPAAADPGASPPADQPQPSRKSKNR